MRIYYKNYLGKYKQEKEKKNILIVYNKMNVFFNPTNNRINITKGTPTINTLPIGLNVTVNDSGHSGTIKTNEGQKYTLEEADFADNKFSASEFRFNPNKVEIKYSSKDNSISFSDKNEMTRGGKNIRKTKRKMNKKRKTNKRR